MVDDCLPFRRQSRRLEGVQQRHGFAPFPDRDFLPTFHTVGRLTYVNSCPKVTHMIKTQVYLRKEELDALRMAAARSGRSVAELVREAIRKNVLKPQAAGPVAIWDGEPKRASIEHDSVHDEP